MSEIMSSPTDWSQFYQNLSNQEIPSRVRMVSSEGAEATVVSTTIMSSSPVGSGPSGHLSPEGRVGKPARRRSRASRRTPTTLFNTDATNFRAMVQQFTGGPSAVPFAAAGGTHPNFGFSFGGREPHVNPAGSLMVPLQLQYQQQQQNPLIQHQNQPYMFSLNRNNNNDGVSSEVPPSGTTSSSSNGNRSNISFMF